VRDWIGPWAEGHHVEFLHPFRGQGGVANS
jgi:hypothetical protein